MALMKTNLSGKLSRDDKLQFPNIENPQIVGCFSIDTNREYQNSADKFQYFRKPCRLPLNLNIGYGQAKTKPENSDERARLYPVLHFILDHKEELMAKRRNLPEARAVESSDFITFRGLLRNVMSTPYEHQQDWCVLATSFRGNIYLCEKETDQKCQERLNMSEYQKKCCAYGLKFEQYCLSSSPYEDPKTNVPVDECEEFHCVFKTKLPDMTLLYGAEMDGVLSNNLLMNIMNKDVLNSQIFMELKCCLRPSNERQYQNFCKFKTRNWWCQCFLAGIRDLMVGYRNEAGFIEEIVAVQIQSLLQLGANHWSPSQCANFLIKFLRLVKNLMKNVNCPYTVYEFYFNPRSRDISFRIHVGKTAYTILPDWYVAEL